MSSKAFASALLGALLVLSGSSCSLYEGPPPPRKKEMKGLGCLKDFGARLGDYFDGKAKPGDVNRLADCSVDAIRAFQDVVRGEERDRFTAKEIRNFFQKYFLEDIVISDAFLQEIMRVKQAFLGGKVTDFTREDLRSAESMIRTFQSIFLRLHVSMPITLDRMKTESEAYVDESGRAIVDAAELLGQKLTEVDSVYKIEELGRFLDEFSRSIPSRAESLRLIRENLQVLGRVKETLTSPYGDRDTITAREWKFLLQDGSRWFAFYSKLLNLRQRHSSWTRGAGRARFVKVSLEAIDLLSRAASRHCPLEETGSAGCRIAPGIPLSVIQELIDETKWDPEFGGVKFRKETLRGIFPVVVRRLLGGMDTSASGRSATRLTPYHLERLRELLREWADGARYVEGVYTVLAGTPYFGEGVSFSTEKLTAISPEDVLSASGGVTEEGLRVAEGLRKVFGETVNLTVGNSRYILYDGKNRTRARSYAELTRYTWLRPLLKGVVRGYGSEPKAGKPVKGLLLSEFTQFVSDYWQVLTDFHLVGKSNDPKTDAERRMREASLFNQSGDGDEFVSIDEGVQLLLQMISVDPMNREAHARIAKLCPNGEIDEYEKPSIEPYCYRREFYDFTSTNPHFSDLWKSFPILVKFFEGLESTEREEFVRYVETISRKQGHQEKVYFNSADTQASLMLFHYVEEVFQRFDENSDGFIDESEAQKAFPVFRRILANVGGLDPDGMLVKKVFFWLLAKGSPPVTDDMNWWRTVWNGTKLVLWSWGGPKFKADRLGLLKVFAALASAASAQAKASTPPVEASPEAASF